MPCALRRDGAEHWADFKLMGDDAPGMGAAVTIQLGFVQSVVPGKEALEAQALFGEIVERL